MMDARRASYCSYKIFQETASQGFCNGFDAFFTSIGLSGSVEEVDAMLCYLREVYEEEELQEKYRKLDFSWDDFLEFEELIHSYASHDKEPRW